MTDKPKSFEVWPGKYGPGSGPDDRPDAPESVTCQWCHAEMKYDAGYYYHEHKCHARDVRSRIKQNEAEHKRLLVELEHAEYVGD